MNFNAKKYYIKIRSRYNNAFLFNLLKKKSTLYICYKNKFYKYENRY